MSKVLITGMTASHTSPVANEKNLSFAGIIYKALKDQGHTVVMTDADLSWTRESIDYYDVVLVGIAPIMSLSANSSYGALHVLDLMWDSPRLTLLVDAPKPEQIAASLRAINLNNDLLTKQFYANRKGYQFASNPDNAKRLISTVERLLLEPLPPVMYPCLPWNDPLSISELLPLNIKSVKATNMDSLVLSPNPDALYTNRTSRWIADDIKSAWTQRVLPTLAYPAMPMRLNKSWTDKIVEEQLKYAVGALITPHKKRTWWTYRYIQALNVCTPIATEWRESARIGASWAALASGIESLSTGERRDLALRQASDYIKAIPSRQDALRQLHDELGMAPSLKKG